MKHSSKNFTRLLGALALLCCAAASAGANDRDAVRDRDLSRVISAKAGGVNNVAGDATFGRAGANDWKRLTTSDHLKSGDAVRTGADGRVEILLNPGSYLRLGPNTEFVFADTTLDKLRLRLTSGSALVEVTGFSDIDVVVTFETPEGNMEILRSGLYRFNAWRSTAEVFVHNGRARVGEVLVKGGQFARLARGASDPVVAKFDKKQQRDALDLWSRERARDLAKINERLQRRSVSTLLAHARFDDLFFGSFGHVGVWLWSPYDACYTFVPFAYGWPSPYGFQYGVAYWGYGRGFCTPCHPGLRRHWDNGWGSGNTTWTDPGPVTAPNMPKSNTAADWKSPAPASAPAPARTSTERSIGGAVGAKGDKP